MDTPSPTPLSTPTPSGNSPVLIGLVVVSMLIAVGVTGYFLTQSPATETTSGTNQYASTNTTTTAKPIDVAIFEHISTETDRTGSDDASTVTYLQGHDDELSYCSKFDEATDGATAAELTDPMIAETLSSRAGASTAPMLIEKLTTIMNIDGGLLTDLCNHNGDIWALVLSSDLQTMTPYHYSGSTESLNAYNPFLTQGGYGSLYFDHIADTTVVATIYQQEEGLLDWEYYALDRDSGATDLIERCTRDARSTEVSLMCSREYMP
jgi:hypothetical protein